MNRFLAGNLVWPVTERLLGRDTLRRFRKLRASDFASRETLAELQTRKLQYLLKVVAEHCPFYRERFQAAGVDVRDPALGLNVLAHLPLLEREEIQENLADMTWHDCPGGPARPYNTGGSSGRPLKFYIDRCRQACDWAARFRARSWWGIHPGDREIMLWAGSVPGRNGMTTRDRLRIWRDQMLNQFVLDAFNMSEQTMDAYAARIAQLRPQVLYGYSSSLALLARHMLARGRSLDSQAAPRAVFVTGETIAPRDARDVQAAFGAPVVVEYGSRDCGLLACGCRAGRLHVVEEHVIVEVLDENGQPTPPGEVGEVVVTSLESFATPIIRYRVGDLALVPERGAEARGGRTHDGSEGRCACGRASRQLMEIRGRVTDQIVRREDGEVRRMHALSLIYVLREAEGLRQFRIVQDSFYTLEVEVVADQRFTPAVERTVLEGLRQRMGPEVDIRITRRDHIAPAASGKHLCVLSKVA